MERAIRVYGVYSEAPELRPNRVEQHEAHTLHEDLALKVDVDGGAPELRQNRVEQHEAHTLSEVHALEVVKLNDADERIHGRHTKGTRVAALKLSASATGAMTLRGSW